MKKLLVLLLIIFTYNTGWGAMSFFEKSKLAEANKLYEEQKYDEALGVYQELRDKYIDNALAWYGMGAIFYANKMYDKAIDKFQTAIKLDPNFSTAMYWLGNAYEKNGDKQEAVKYWKMALEKNSKNEEAKNRLKAAGTK